MNDKMTSESLRIQRLKQREKRRNLVVWSPMDRKVILNKGILLLLVGQNETAWDGKSP